MEWTLTYVFTVQDRKSGRCALHLACEEANLELMCIFLEMPNCLHFINAKVSWPTVLNLPLVISTSVACFPLIHWLMGAGCYRNKVALAGVSENTH